MSRSAGESDAMTGSNIARCPFSGKFSDTSDEKNTSEKNNKMNPESSTDASVSSTASGGVLELLTSREQIHGEEVVNIITDLFLAAADTVSHLIDDQGKETHLSLTHILSSLPLFPLSLSLSLSPSL